MSTTAERLLETVRTLPEPLLAEVLDFAAFLQSRQPNMCNQPVSISLASLFGGLESTKTFNGSPLAFQQQMRNEWR